MELFKKIYHPFNLPAYTYIPKASGKAELEKESTYSLSILKAH